MDEWIKLDFEISQSINMKKGNKDCVMPKRL